MSNDFPYELNERMRQNAGERPPELGQALTSVRGSQQGRTHIQNRYTPSLKRPLSKVYRPWFFVVALCALLIGIAIIVCSSIMKDTDNDVADHIFHLWVGIPLIFVALLGVTVSAMKDRKVVVLFLVVTLIVMVICGCAALISGMRFWRDGWQATRTQLNRSGKCKDVNNQCTCTGILTLPSKAKTCNDVELVVNLFICEIALAAFGFVFCVAGVYLSFAAICCGPWMYMKNYDKEYDPDFCRNVPVP